MAQKPKNTTYEEPNPRLPTAAQAAEQAAGPDSTQPTGTTPPTKNAKE